MLVDEYTLNKSLDLFIFVVNRYVIDGVFSVKSDVFSFGILLREIINGKKNRGLSIQYRAPTILNILWKEGIPLEVVEECLGESCNLSEVIRCIHISLLCVQQHPKDRPSMSSVILTLGSETELPHPKQPGFLFQKSPLEENSSSDKRASSSRNEMTLSVLNAR
ncbi:receptor-like serine/threonine-protein kinase SD1-7 [Herrania umbratica]|uniref:Receptor-like serine/threonine-protein kinase SD1-7 n=1 Tax=Herrania umbratica TaxID=108875 RepID=A0A6J1AQY9_9ROSI|nr:receptor-like serine/threonine-protein kinase SD1-7 [Herrania umbratica]